MQTSQKHPTPAGIHFYPQPVQDINPYNLAHYQFLQSNLCHAMHNSSSQGTTISFETYKGDQFFTLDSFPATTNLIVCDSPSSVSVSSNRSPFSPQGSHQSCLSYQHQSPDNTYGSPTGGASSAVDGNNLKHKLRELEITLLGPDSNIVESSCCSYKGGLHQAYPVNVQDPNQLAPMISKLDLKEILTFCAKAIAEDDDPKARGLMDNVLVKMVSVSGEPIQRLGAYLLEGLRARLESSGSRIYKSLKCEHPTSKELMSYMHVLYLICPYWKFAYVSSNAVIKEAMENESRIHIIDFQIAQGTQWMALMQTLAHRPGGPPFIRITGIDDSQSFHARGGGLRIVGEKLSEFAMLYGVPFEFHSAAMSGCEVERKDLDVRPGEALAVNFPFVLHHMPDESVSTENHRDRLLRLVKSLLPKVVTLVEQESNTNTSPFFNRFLETMDYYTAMFESIDVARPRDDKQRIKAEQHCIARDIVNMIACEGPERVERHELLGKWKSRFAMAGFSQCQLSPSVTVAVRDVLKDFHENFRCEQSKEALYLGWKNRAMATCSAWR